MSAPAPVELTVDCPSCLLEGGVVEVYDPLVPACRFGLPATTRCKLCGAASEGIFAGTCPKPLDQVPANRCPGCHEPLSASAIDERACAACAATAMLRASADPASFETKEDIERALSAWANREGFPSKEALVASTLVESDLGKLFERVQARAKLEVVADPFATMGMRASGGGGERAPRTEPAARTVPTPVPELPPRSAPPRALVFPLVSVIAADGEIHPEERALIDRFLKSEGLPPLAEEELRVHAPSEVAHLVPRERREDVVKLMCESAACDGLPDEAERRVIRAYATAWDIDEEKLELWMWAQESIHTSFSRQLFLKLRRFVLSARWAGDET